MTYPNLGELRRQRRRAADQIEKNIARVTVLDEQIAARVEANNLDPALVRAWAVAAGLPVGERGKVGLDLRYAYLDAHPGEATS